MSNHLSQYEKYCNLLSQQSYPIAVLDVDLLNKNIQKNLERAGNKKIRIASKSIRCVEVMKRIFDYHPQFQGIMAFHGLEAIHLTKAGFDDILLGYPIVDKNLLYKIAEEVKKGKKICLMVDCLEHLEITEEVGRKTNTQFQVCVDIDLSKDYPGLRFGVWRSSIFNKKTLQLFLDKVKNKQHIKLCGLMGYEAQIAGLGDNISGNFLTNQVVNKLKSTSIKHIKKWRKEAIDLIQENGFELSIVNGGGTGSLETTIAEEEISEVTVGSGFFCSHLFDNYNNFNLEPAFFYGVQVVRNPKPDIFTCHGGGFIASGEPEAIKAPIIHLPNGLSMMPNEGAGEVQTPLKVKNKTKNFGIGSPVFFRHAKAGELCERFNKIIFIKEDNSLSESLTYRGMGWSFG